ncbi:histidine kinase [Noviherbaspirillum cavernae]|uniref:Histidine kinase n=1 Tax=Noviherbaspirillum cavernae TaxID=2320862 RepID=A0A418WVL7_9BURK|nr:flagellar motor protein MotB [Noviherbaspirillum cavernae]RJF96698.1 histidine kinase [Noviherbaspirillum cavernae]
MLNKLDKHDKHQEAVIKRAARKHDDDGHGGAWKVAFADFCLALMCLFLVLWVMAAREKESIQEEMNNGGGNSKVAEGSSIMPETIGGPRGSMIERALMPGRGETGPAGPSSGAPAAKTRYESKDDLETLSRVLENLSSEGGLASNLQTIVTPYGLRVMLHDTEKQGMYVRGSSVPTDRFKALLRKMGPLFAQMENQMLIVGHTDSLQYADGGHAAFSNWTLSSNRAMSARAQLLAGGMAGDGILQVVGMADRAPLDDKQPAAAVNRRIELLILTSGQAQAITSMFGMPGEVQPLTKDVDSALPDIDALKALRARLIPVKGGATHANQ